MRFWDMPVRRLRMYRAIWFYVLAMGLGSFFLVRETARPDMPEHQTIDEIQHHTRQEQRVFEIGESHGVNVRWECRVSPSSRP